MEPLSRAWMGPVAVPQLANFSRDAALLPGCRLLIATNNQRHPSRRDGILGGRKYANISAAFFCKRRQCAKSSISIISALFCSSPTVALTGCSISAAILRSPGYRRTSQISRLCSICGGDTKHQILRTISLSYRSVERRIVSVGSSCCPQRY
ncbi:uncharacterized protein M421DRAFT_307672 [Didymella exigua CBS 183.55]|uniref:Uncharacterized protein n=1 Tax=Didymella exigua CBS 183.55 TaxID=1150837 RepID=A0A6A5R915_9PLEO|nr:uncharacterized protein M421DRAFT_307672 [Didymella exigua CBS 183.55]KAF1923678.1 hypothetical protein M421DRAFT_307672 [Didymella exigua CBS 183.55]